MGFWVRDYGRGVSYTRCVWFCVVCWWVGKGRGERVNGELGMVELCFFFGKRDMKRIGDVE